MRFPIDVAFCDGDGTVLRLVTCRPVGRVTSAGRPAGRSRPRARSPRGVSGSATCSRSARELPGASGWSARPGRHADRQPRRPAPRAAGASAAASVVACEDTRRTGRLLHHLGVRARSCSDWTTTPSSTSRPSLLDRVRSGEVVAVASDAGMPGLSDPGARLAAPPSTPACGWRWSPGRSPRRSALVGSGLLDPSGRFCFEGFLPRKGAARAARLDELVGERRTVVLYEAPHRLARTLADLATRSAAIVACRCAAS